MTSKKQKPKFNYYLVLLTALSLFDTSVEAKILFPWKKILYFDRGPYTDSLKTGFFDKLPNGAKGEVKNFLSEKTGTTIHTRGFQYFAPGSGAGHTQIEAVIVNQKNISEVNMSIPAYGFSYGAKVEKLSISNNGNIHIDQSFPGDAYMKDIWSARPSGIINRNGNAPVLLSRKMQIPLTRKGGMVSVNIRVDEQTGEVVVSQKVISKTRYSQAGDYEFRVKIADGKDGIQKPPAAPIDVIPYPDNNTFEVIGPNGASTTYYPLNQKANPDFKPVYSSHPPLSAYNFAINSYSHSGETIAAGAVTGNLGKNKILPNSGKLQDNNGSSL